jgi:class 3 adenylate cyclase
VSPQLAELMLGEDPDRYLQSHRREIAVLACDLRGFAASSESMEPEVVMSVLKEYHECLGALSEAFEATIERFAGDRVMLVFNDPLPCPNPPYKAVCMGVALRDRISKKIESWRVLEFDVGLRIGIAFGYATLGQIGFEGRYEYAAIGPIPYLASALCDQGTDGQILVTQRALAAVQEVVEATALGNLQLPGFTRAVRAHNILGLREPAPQQPADRESM